MEVCYCHLDLVHTEILKKHREFLGDFWDLFRVRDCFPCL